MKAILLVIKPMKKVTPGHEKSPDQMAEAFKFKQAVGR